MGIGIADIIDILMVATLLYLIYRLMKASGSLNMFIGILIFISVGVVVSQILRMRMLGSIFDKLLSVGVIALLIIFQDEARRFFITLGSQKHFGFMSHIFKNQTARNADSNAETMALVKACIDMSRGKVGALIVLEKDLPLSDIVNTGDIIDAQISTRLIENIFFKNSPLHDGAMIVSRNRIKAAACLLPVSHNLSIPKHLGLRHRAALGISQESDSISIIVSEETGGISVAHKGEFKLDMSSEELEQYLTSNYYTD